MGLQIVCSKGNTRAVVLVQYNYPLIINVKKGFVFQNYKKKTEKRKLFHNIILVVKTAFGEFILRSNLCVCVCIFMYVYVCKYSTNKKIYFSLVHSSSLSHSLNLFPLDNYFNMLQREKFSSLRAIMAQFMLGGWVV